MNRNRDTENKSFPLKSLFESQPWPSSVTLQTLHRQQLGAPNSPFWAHLEYRFLGLQAGRNFPKGRSWTLPLGENVSSVPLEIFPRSDIVTDATRIVSFSGDAHAPARKSFRSTSSLDNPGKNFRSRELQIFRNGRLLTSTVSKKNKVIHSVHWFSSEPSLPSTTTLPNDSTPTQRQRFSTRTGPQKAYDLAVFLNFDNRSAYASLNISQN